MRPALLSLVLPQRLKGAGCDGDATWRCGSLGRRIAGMAEAESFKTDLGSINVGLAGVFGVLGVHCDPRERRVLSRARTTIE